jgi:hypothetical protein
MQLSRVSNLTYKDGEKTIQEGIVTRASVTKNHLQTEATALKDIQYEVYAYEIKSLNKFKISKGSEFINDDGRLIIEKVKTINKETKEKLVSFYLKCDNKEDPRNNVISTLNPDDLKKLLENENYEQIAQDESKETDNE